MHILNLYSCIWSIIETFAMLTVIFIFFNDPIRRWNFFGYRPTAIMAIFDPKHKKILLARKDGEPWLAFSQGGIYNSDMNFTVKEILRRELGLDSSRFGLRYTQNLGTIKINDPELLKRSTLSSISLARGLRGKGYLACYIRANLELVEKEVQLGEGIAEVKVLDIKEARNKVEEQGKHQTPSKHGKKKQSMLLSILKEIEDILAKNKNEEESCPSELKDSDPQSQE